METYDANGQRLRFGEMLGRGGEGEVFPLKQDETLVAKILQPSRRRKNKYVKLQAMLKRPPAGAYDLVDGFPILSWPRGLIFNDPEVREFSTFVGYTMTRIQSRDFVPLFQVTTFARRAKLGGAPVTFDLLVKLGARLTHLVRTLHRFGYAVGDLNDRNVLVSRKFTPLLMDTDSFQVPRRLLGHHPSTVGDQLYWPPELLGVDLTTNNRSRVEGDRYALATLLFQLFMNGNRPYQARGSTVDEMESLIDKTQAGFFPWTKPWPGVLEPPGNAPDFNALPAPLRKAFERAFVAGHKQPSKRPTAEHWHKILVGLSKGGFQNCPVSKAHVFTAGATLCPWCADPNNPFDPQARKRARKTKIKQPAKAKRVAASKSRAAKPVELAPVQGAEVEPAAPVARKWLVAWAVLVAAIFIAPTVWFLRLPLGIEKQIVAALIAVAAIAAPGVWAARKYVARPRIKVAAMIGWTLMAAAGAGAIASASWTALFVLTGVVVSGGGLAMFGLMEWRNGRLLNPKIKSAVSMIAGLPIAWLPTAIVLAWIAA